MHDNDSIGSVVEKDKRIPVPSKNLSMKIVESSSDTELVSTLGKR